MQQRSKPRRRIGEGAALFAGMIATIFLSGCSSVIYPAASLAPEFRAAPTAKHRSVDLTRLATSGEPGNVIGPGDILSVTLSTDYQEDGPNKVFARVDDSGNIGVALIGEVAVAGFEPTEAEQKIAEAAIERRVFQRPRVTVMIERKFTNTVTVVGAVENPGVVTLDRSNSDLLGALASVGGLTKNAGHDVQITRKRPPRETQRSGAQLASLGPPTVGPTTQKINLSEAAQSGLGDYRLHDGDVVMVYESEPRSVYVSGLVREPQQIEIPPGEDIRLLSALAMAGGRTMQIADKVHVIRRVPGMPEPIVIEVSVREAKKNGDANLLLAADDEISVEETPTTFILGTVQQLIRVGISGSTPLF